MTPTPADDVALPIDMVLHCPACGMQHIDAPEPGKLISGGPSAGRVRAGWVNPPHRSHLCHGCGHIWRPADVPTNGVAAVKTKGKADSPVAADRAKRAGLTDEQIDAAIAGCEKIVPDKAGWIVLQRRAYARAIEAAHGITPPAPTQTQPAQTQDQP